MANYRTLPAALALLLCAAGAHSAAAQRPDSAAVAAAAAAAGGAAEAHPRDRAGTDGPTTPAPLLDVPVNRTDYPLGPGDVLELGIFGAVNDHYTLTVGPEGTVVVPEIGVARVLGLNLDQAEARLREQVYRLYRDVQVRLTLSRVRTFKVFVVGTVPDPGVRTASAATRVSEVVPVTQGGAARRNIQLRRASGETLLLDLVPFLQSGDLRANPTLREGDALVVPVADRIVQVLGRVAFPAAYEFREGESLADLLRVANGGGDFPASAADTLLMTRFTDAGERQVILLSRAEAVGARGRALTMRPYDAVFVPEVANFRQQKTATVFGQVMHPGVYPIQPDTTTVRELVAMAGGFTPQASLVAGTLRRTPEPGLRRPLIELVSDSALTSDERQVRAIAQADSGQAFVVIDFEQLFLHGAEAFNQRIQNGDQLVIPRLRHEVTVLGAVLRPGIVEYRQGASFEDYVRLAGGYSRRADRGGVALIRAGLGNQLQARDVWYPQPGDQVVVPFAPRRPVLERLRSVNAFVTAIATTLVSVVFLARL